LEKTQGYQMIDQVLIVTEPDDTTLNGYRILLVDLTSDQSQAVSLSLLNIKLFNRVVLYSWNSNDSIEWLLDKKTKSNIVLFNADSCNDLLVGYLSAQTNSYYFGELKLLAGANNSRLYAQQDCQELLDYMISKDGKF
jgi:hypothetical protein